MRLIPILLLAAMLVVPPHARASDVAEPVVLQAPVFVAQVDGDFELDADGRVTAYRAVTPAPDHTVAAVERFVRALRFQMLDEDARERPRVGRIRLTLVRDVVPGGASDVVRVENVTFPVVSSIPETERLTPIPSLAVHKVMPRYPSSALDRAVRARVLASVLVAEDGATEQVVIRQLSLRAVQGPPRLLARMASDFQMRALDALRQWRYDVTTPQETRLSAEDRTGMVTILFTLEDSVEKPFQWMHETRTVVRQEPWLEPNGQCCRMGVSDASVRRDDEQISDRFELLDDPRGRVL